MRARPVSSSCTVLPPPTQIGLRCGSALSVGLFWAAMNLQKLRGRMPLVAFVLLAVICLAILGFACACLSDQPMQALERALGAIPSLPALIEVWSLTILSFLAAGAAAAAVRPRSRAPSPALLQRFLS